MGAVGAGGRGEGHLEAWRNTDALAATDREVDGIAAHGGGDGVGGGDVRRQVVGALRQVHDYLAVGRGLVLSDGDPVGRVHIDRVTGGVSLEIDVGKSAVAEADVRAVERFRGAERDAHLAEAIGNVTRRGLRRRDLCFRGRGVRNREVVVIIIVVVVDGAAEGGDVQGVAAPEAGLAVEAAQRQLILAFVGAGRRIKTSFEPGVTVAKTRGKRGARRGPIHARRRHGRIIDSVDAEGIGQAVAVRVVIGGKGQAPQKRGVAQALGRPLQQHPALQVARINDKKVAQVHAPAGQHLERRVGTHAERRGAEGLEGLVRPEVHFRPDRVAHGSWVERGGSEVGQREGPARWSGEIHARDGGVARVPERAVACDDTGGVR